MHSDAVICHINLAKDFRGGERQTELLIRALASFGIQQRLVIREGNTLGHRLQDVPALETRAVASNPVSAAFAIRGATLAHAHDGRSVYSALLANEMFGIPYVLTRRVVNQKSRGYIRNRAYGHAARVFAVSQATAVAMLRFGQQAEVIMDAYAELPVDEAAVADIRARFPGKTLIGHVGALELPKGQQTIFTLAREALIEHPDWQFVFLGEGPDREVFEAQVRDLPNVTLVGFVENVGDYLRAFDLFVFPSRLEALGSTLLDAMHAGLAIVATRAGGIPEIIVEGRNGILLDADDAVGFYAAIEVLLDDAAERARLESNNRKDVQQYSADEMASAYLRAYQEIMG